MIMTEEQLLCARAHINLPVCNFSVNVIFYVVKSSALLSCLASDECPSVKHHRPIYAQIYPSLAIYLNTDFSQRVYKSCCHPVAVMFLVMYVDNNGIRHNCEELGQEFEKFVVMAMKSGANFDSLPILGNPNNFVVHAYAAFILELSYVATNNLPQLNSFKSYSSRSFSKQHLFISRMPDFWFHYLLGITDRKSSW